MSAKKSISRFGERPWSMVEDWMARRSLVETGEIIPSASFAWVAELEANWTAIRRELDDVMQDRARLPAIQEFTPELQYTIDQGRVWKVFVFRAYGVRSELNCRKCPETARLLDRIPDLELACFSVLEPGAHLGAHRGVYKGLIRTHLGLIVPEPHAQVRMQVGGKTVHWEEGRCVVFDDTYLHEVWNDTESVRVVLLLDVPRPFPPLLASINKAALRAARLTPFAKGGVKRFRAWEKAHYAERPNRPA